MSTPIATARSNAASTLLVLALVTFSGGGGCARSRAPSPAPQRDAEPAPRHSIVWEHDENTALARARAERKGLMVSFHATWCVPCEELEQLLNDDRIYKTVIDHFVALQVDVSDDSPESDEKKRRFGVSGPLPRLLLFAVDDRNRRLLVTIGPDTPNYLQSDGLLQAISPAIELAAP